MPAETSHRNKSSYSSPRLGRTPPRHACHAANLTFLFIKYAGIDQQLQLTSVGSYTTCTTSVWPVVPEHTCTADGWHTAGRQAVGMVCRGVPLAWEQAQARPGKDTIMRRLALPWRIALAARHYVAPPSTGPCYAHKLCRCNTEFHLLIRGVLGGALAVPDRRLHHARNTLEGQLGAPAVNSTGAGQASQLMPCSLHHAGTSWTDSLGSPAAIGRRQYTRRDMRRTACLGCKQAGAAGTAAGGRAGRRTRSSRRQRWPAAGAPRG